MLPNYEICRKHLLAYKRKAGTQRADTITFSAFWNYKTGLENAGQSILDEKNIDNTAFKLCGLLSYLKVNNHGLTEAGRLKQILRNVRPYYADIMQVTLGSGKAHLYQKQIEAVYAGMAKKDSREDTAGRDYSIVSKSALLMAVWGQVPRFDSINRKRFAKWTNWPSPEKLPFLTVRDTWYRPTAFRELVVALDKWVKAWPDFNQGQSFNSCFADLCPGTPPGRLIDIIYHWEVPKVGMDYLLKTGGSYLDRSHIDTINKFTVD